MRIRIAPRPDAVFMRRDENTFVSCRRLADYVAMTPEQQSSLKQFLASLSRIRWFSQAGNPHEDGVVVPDIVAGWDGLNAAMFAVWQPRTHDLESRAQEIIDDTEIDEVFGAVARAIEDGVRSGMQAYFDRRPAIRKPRKSMQTLACGPKFCSRFRGMWLGLASRRFLAIPVFFRICCHTIGKVAGRVHGRETTRRVRWWCGYLP
mgnify:CR=1 FL=1